MNASCRRILWTPDSAITDDDFLRFTVRSICREIFRRLRLLPLRGGGGGGLHPGWERNEIRATLPRMTSDTEIG